MKSSSATKESKPLTPVEESLKETYLEEYNERFPNILEENPTEFFVNLRKRVMFSLEDKYPNLPEETISKVEANIKEEYYNSHFEKVSAMYLKAMSKNDNWDNNNGSSATSFGRKSRIGKDCNSESPVYFRGNFIKHCKLTQEPVHACEEKLVQIWASPNDNNNSSFFLFCLKCTKVYQPNCIQLFCPPCKLEYYSSWTGDSSESEYQPATWAKYHCGIIYNEKMKCIKCKEIFYFSQKTGWLMCLNCKLSADPLNIQWTCVLCKEEFKSEAKAYNPNEFKSVKLAVKNALFEKINATPNYSFHCCKEIDPENTIFVHKKDCTGELFLGKLNGKQIVVCSKCRSMNLYEKYVWSCPFCYKRFKRNNGISKQNTADESSEPLNTSLSPKRIPNRFPGNNANTPQIQDSFPKSPKIKHNASYFDFIALANLSPRNSPKLSNRRNRQTLGSDISLECPFSIKLEDASAKKNLIDDLNNLPSIEEDVVSENCKKNACNNNNIKKNIVPLSKELSKGVFQRMNTSPYEELLKPQSPIRNQKKIFCQIKNCEIQNMGSELNLSIYDEKQKDPSFKSSFQEVSLNSKETSDTDTSKESLTKSGVKCSLASINIDDYKIIKQVGEGSYGIIYQVESNYCTQPSSPSRKKGKSSLSKESFAMKKIIAHSQKEINDITREYEMLNSISISTKCKNFTLNLISIYGIQAKMLDQTTYAIYVLMDLALTDWEKEIIERNKAKSYYSEEELMEIMKGLVFSLAELQRAKIAHRDIKPQNILVFPNNVYKIADFGEAKQLLSYKNSNQTIRGTELYMSPILFQTIQTKKNPSQNTIEHNAFKSDVFSLGMCFLLAGTLTFNSINDIRQLKDMSQMTYIVNRYLKIRYSGQFIGIIQNMLELNEKGRCDFLELEQILLNGL